MKKFFSFVLVLAVVCSSQLLLSGVVLADKEHYVIDTSSTTENQNYEGYSTIMMVERYIMKAKQL